MTEYLRLIRVRHYIKNALIYSALIFSGQMLGLDKLRACTIGFFAFCFISSVIYIINDIKDKDKDCLHPQKCNRPIAKGSISVKTAVIVAIVCLMLAIICFAFIFDLFAMFLLIAYVVINISYSFGLKNIPLVDVSLLVAGFLIRVLYGAAITNIRVSGWLYLTVIAMAFFMAFGKRRNEYKITNSNNTRAVLKGYSISFLDKSMYMCLTMSNTFYSLWALSTSNTDSNSLKILTVPVVLLITLKYSLNIEKETSDGDPTEVLFHDKALLLLCLIYVVMILLILYLDKLQVFLKF